MNEKLLKIATDQFHLSFGYKPNELALNYINCWHKNFIYAPSEQEYAVFVKTQNDIQKILRNAIWFLALLVSWMIFWVIMTITNKCSALSMVISVVFPCILMSFYYLQRYHKLKEQETIYAGKIKMLHSEAATW